MSIATAEKLYAPEDLLSLPDGEAYELVDGRLVEKPVGFQSGQVGGALFARLYLFNARHQLGWIVPESTGYQCFPWLPRHLRRADVSFVSLARLTEAPRGHSKVAPDLAVEVVSPRDLAADLSVKVSEYLRAGVRLVWIINPDSRTADIYRSDGSVARLRDDDYLDGEAVLPGFRCRLADILDLEPGDAAILQDGETV